MYCHLSCNVRGSLHPWRKEVTIKHAPPQGMSRHSHSRGSSPSERPPGWEVSWIQRDTAKEPIRKIYTMLVRSSCVWPRVLPNNAIDSLPLGSPQTLTLITDVLAITLQMNFIFKRNLFNSVASINFKTNFFGLSGQINVYHLQRIFFPPRF